MFEENSRSLKVTRCLSKTMLFMIRLQMRHFILSASSEISIEVANIRRGLCIGNYISACLLFPLSDISPKSIANESDK